MRKSLPREPFAGRIIEQGEFQSESDLLKLSIVDWNRLINYWDNVYEATVSISSLLCKETPGESLGEELLRVRMG